MNRFQRGGDGKYILYKGVISIENLKTQKYHIFSISFFFICDKFYSNHERIFKKANASIKKIKITFK